MAWNPFGVSLEISATAGTVTRTSATQFTVKINASWETYYSGNKTLYGMAASSGGASVTLNPFGTKSSGGSGSLTGTYSISGNAAATKTITVTFRNFNNDNGDSATNTINLTVNVPAWTSYTVSYNANGGTGAPSNQTKWKDQALTISSTKPTKTGYTFQGWATSANGSVAYAAGASYTANAAVTLYAVWKANTYTVKYDANGGTNAPTSQTKTHGVALTLTSSKPTRTNYTFKGWGTAASATTVAYAAGASYTNNATITLYAIWELAYTKPRITNFTVKRCAADGMLQNDGTNALVSFDWESDEPVTEIYISWTPLNSDGGIASIPVNATGTSGTIAEVVRTFAVTESFNITVTVYDTNGNQSETRILTTQKVTRHYKPGGDGVAFGKISELGADESLGGEGVAEFAFDVKFNEPVYGKVLGLDKLPPIPAYSELNDYITTGCWSIPSNAIAATIKCGGVLLGTDETVPPARAGRLEVSSSTGEGIRLEQWSYLRQRIIPYNDTNPIWERDVARGEDNVWQYYEWWKSNLTPEASEKVYSKAAITIALSANTTLGALNTYTKIPFNKNVLSTSNRLTMVDNSIRIGKNIRYVKVSGQTLIKCGSVTGNRHARIQKVTGNTTTNVAWACVYGVATSNTVYPMLPVIVPVQEGDLIKMVFYTSDVTDSNSSGSAANGWQTYMTVEEL